MATKTQRADALQLHSFQVVSEGWNVRAFERDGQPWFVAADVCTALGIQNTTQALEPLDDDERSMFNIGRQGKANCINESGLYTLILRCREATTPGTLALGGSNYPENLQLLCPSCNTAKGAKHPASWEVDRGRLL